MKRREVSFEIEEHKTPSRMDIRRELAVLLRTDVEKIWIRRVATKTGTHTSVGLAHVYDDAKKALEIEPEHIVKRNQPPQKEAEGEMESDEGSP